MNAAEMPKETQETVSNIEPSEECKVEGLNQPQVAEASKVFDTGEKDVKKPSKRKREYVHEPQVAECRKELDDMFEYYKEFSGRSLQISDDKCPSHDSIVATLLEESNLSLPKLAEDIIKKLNGRDGFTLAYVRNIVIRVGQRMKYGIPNELADVLEDESQSTLWCWEARDVKLLPVAFLGSIVIRRRAREMIHKRISALNATLSAISRFEEKAISKSDLFKVYNKLSKVLNKQGISLVIDKLKQNDSADMAEKETKGKEKEVTKEKLRIEKEVKRLKYEAEREQKRIEKEESKQKKQMKKQQEGAVKEQRLREKEEAELKTKLEIQKQASFMERFLGKNKKTGNISENCDKRAPREDLSSETVSKIEEINKAATSSMDSAFSQQYDLTIEELRKISRIQKKRVEKEEAKQKKQMKKQQEGAVKEQRLREKEEAELKTKLEIQKQASFMEHFLGKNKKTGNISENCDKRAPREDLSSETVSKIEEINKAATSSMDSAFSQQYDLTIEELRKLHVMRWLKLSERNRSSHWGVRRSPKTLLVKELKLQRPYMEDEPVRKFATPVRESSSCGMKSGSKSSFYKSVGEVEESFANDSCQNNPIVASASIGLVHKKLLQFDKSNRPAYYGTFCKRSDIIGPRHPFRKDSQLDYDVDSDEEWEEEDPGESLSDFEKDNDESLDEESSKYEDGDESEDGFVVPDGFPSDDEGVEAEASSSDPIEDEVKHSPGWRSEDGCEKFRLLLQQQKFLQELTENALAKSRPFVILNLDHEKSGLLMTEDLMGRAKHEQICMQALCMQPCHGASTIDNLVLVHDPLHEAQESSQAVKGSSTKAVNADTTIISDSDLPEFVSLIQSCPHGINEVVKVVQQKFPAVLKPQLRKEIRKVSDFIDNRWQIKKEILVKLGLPTSPEEVGRSKDGISTYFSKRCSPSPEGVLPNISESSSEQYSKMKAHGDQIGKHGDQNENTGRH